jgi:hypothetical protein
MAIEAAIMPVPGSAVAHIVAFTASAERVLVHVAPHLVRGRQDVPRRPGPLCKPSPFR